MIYALAVYLWIAGCAFGVTNAGGKKSYHPAKLAVLSLIWPVWLLVVWLTGEE